MTLQLYTTIDCIVKRTIGITSHSCNATLSSVSNVAMSVKPLRTCYIAAAMSEVPGQQVKRDDQDVPLVGKRKAIAKFFRDGYSIICSHYKVLYAEPESDNPTEDESKSIVARDLTLVRAADIVALCFEEEKEKKIYSWGAAVELGYAYAYGRPIVIFNLSSSKKTPFFIENLPQDENHKVYIVKDRQSLEKFTEDYQPEHYSTRTDEEIRREREREKKLDDAREALEEVLYPSLVDM